MYPVNILFHFGFQILLFSCLSFPLHSVLFLFHGCRSCVSGCSRSWGLEVISSPRPAQIAFASSQFPSSQPRPLSFVLLVFFFFQISDDPGDLVMFESRIKKKNKQTNWKLCVPTRWLFCRVTRWAPGLFMGGPQIFSIGSSFSGAHFVSVELCPLLPCPRKGNVPEAASSPCSASVQLRKGRPLRADDLGSGAAPESKPPVDT